MGFSPACLEKNVLSLGRIIFFEIEIFGAGACNILIAVFIAIALPFPTGQRC